jgi:hypothetical protein
MVDCPTDILTNGVSTYNWTNSSSKDAVISAVSNTDEAKRIAHLEQTNLKKKDPRQLVEGTLERSLIWISFSNLKADAWRRISKRGIKTEKMQRRLIRDTTNEYHMQDLEWKLIR